MKQDVAYHKHELKIKNYLGVSDIGEITEGEWLYHSQSIKENAPYFFYHENFKGLETVFNWLLKFYDHDAYSAFFMLDELGLIIKWESKINRWDVICSEDKKDKVNAIIGAIEKLDGLLCDDVMPILPEVTHFLGASKEMWSDRKISRLTYKWCIDNKVEHPTVLGVHDFLVSLKSYIQEISSFKKAALKTGMAKGHELSSRVEAMIFSRRMANVMRHIFKLKQNPNTVIAALVGMVYPELEGITAETVQEWLKRRI